MFCKFYLSFNLIFHISILKCNRKHKKSCKSGKQVQKRRDMKNWRKMKPQQKLKLQERSKIRMKSQFTTPYIRCVLGKTKGNHKTHQLSFQRFATLRVSKQIFKKRRKMEQIWKRKAEESPCLQLKRINLLIGTNSSIHTLQRLYQRDSTHITTMVIPAAPAARPLTQSYRKEPQSLK